MVLSEKEKIRKRLHDSVVTNVLVHKMLTGNEIEQAWYNDQTPMFMSEALYKAEYKDIYEFARQYPDELRCSNDYGGSVTLLAGPRPPQLILDNIMLIRTTQKFMKPNPYNQEKGILGRLHSWKYKNAQDKFGTIYAVKKPGEASAAPTSKPATTSTFAFGSSLGRSSSVTSADRPYSSTSAFRSSSAFSSATNGGQSSSTFGSSESYRPAASSTSSFGFRKVGQLGALAAAGSHFGGRFSSSGASVSRSSSFGGRDFGRASWAGLVESQQDAPPQQSIFCNPSAIRERNEIGIGMTNQQFMAAANRLNNVPPRGVLPPELAEEEDDDNPALTPWDDDESDDSDHHYAVPVRKRLIGATPIVTTTELAPKPQEEKENKLAEPVAVVKVEEAKREDSKPAAMEVVKDESPKSEKQQSDSEAVAPPRKRFMFGGAKSANTTADLLKLNAAPPAEPSTSTPKPTVTGVISEPRPVGMESAGTQFPEPSNASEYSCGISSLYLHRLRWYRQRRGEMV